MHLKYRPNDSENGASCVRSEIVLGCRMRNKMAIMNFTAKQRERSELLLEAVPSANKCS